MDVSDGTGAAALRYLGNEGPSNIVTALDCREKYGKRCCRSLARIYRAELTLSKLSFYSKFVGYDYKMLKWKEMDVSRELYDFIGPNGAFLGLSGDSSYLIAVRVGLLRTEAMLYFIELSPESAVQRSFLYLPDLSPHTRVRIYFHPLNRFISSFIYDQSHLLSAYKNGLSESSTFKVVTIFPDLMLRLSLSSSATIVCRNLPKGKGMMRKDYLRIHDNGFALNTGVNLLMILFSKTPPTKIKYMQKMWRVIRRDKGPTFGGRPHTVSADLGEEISVESSIMQETDFERMSYQLVGCEDHSYSDTGQLFGLLRPLYISRHVVCIESLIDRSVNAFIRRSKSFKGACYKGSRDYETDVNCVDDQGVCKLIIICVCEVQVPFMDSENTRNIFYLCRIDTSWSVYRGWIPGGACRFLKELPHALAFNPRCWYPFARFPVEQNEYTYNVANRGMFYEKPQQRLTSFHGCLDVILDSDE
ncbi:unnamed protein product [Cylicocyclus nassatus]|uniref:Uncharacterized protein n=1 Tax=Cylicocyclus nassatus TaxID=53992 RepID=A0AA36HB70_CYLNA|nr:unnamed protein product [Cylicocyclus nassatus]